VAPHTSSSSTKIAAAMSHWCSRADLNAFTIVGSAGFSPEFMPGTKGAPFHGWRAGAKADSPVASQYAAAAQWREAPWAP
jgi:hypothetical protein